MPGPTSRAMVLVVPCGDPARDDRASHAGKMGYAARFEMHMKELEGRIPANDHEARSRVYLSRVRLPELTRRSFDTPRAESTTWRRATRKQRSLYTI